MKTAGRIVLSAAAAAVIHLVLFHGLWIALCGVGWLFSATSASAWYFTINGCVLCYLPALGTGLIVRRVQGSFRPEVSAPLGVVASWALLLGLGALASSSTYWTSDQNSIVPWLFNSWGLDHYYASLFAVLSTGLMARLGVEWSEPQQEAKWLLILLVAFNAVVACGVLRYFLLPCFDHDEVEQSHVIWALSQGVIPYRDIHQIHMPLLWTLAWPVMQWLPRALEAVLALRIACAAALIGSYVAGLLMLREILGTGSFFGHGRPKNVPVPLSEPKGTVPFLRPTTPGVVPAAKIGTVPALVLLLMVLAVVPDFQLHLFRTDPFMTCCSAWAILAAVRMRRAPALYSFLCGLAFALAASFSIRLSWLCFVVPVVCLWESGRQRSLRPLWLALPNAAGFVIGMLPVALWIAYHGVFPAFWSWVVVGNSGSIHVVSGFQLLDMVFLHRFFTTSALLGGFWLLWRQWHAPRQAWSPVNALLVSALLAWSVPVTNSLHLLPGGIHFAFQVIMIPGAVLGTVLVVNLLACNLRAWQLRLAVVGLVFALIEAQTPAPEQMGAALTKNAFRELNALCSAENATCVCFAPLHPIFCRDAADLYLGWDAGIATNSTYSPWMQRKHRQLWPTAIAAIEEGKPTLVGDGGLWDLAHGAGIIDDEQYRRFRQAVRTLYEPAHVDGRLVYTLKQDPASRGKTAANRAGRR